jgi:hypothetical protein
MIILYKRSGDHSNWLFQNLHFEAFCLEYGIKYVNPTFLDMEEYYLSPVQTKHVISAKTLKTRFPAVLRKVRIYKRFFCFDNKHENDKRILLNNSRNNCYCYIKGWSFRVFDLTEKYQDYFIRKYTLKEKYYQENEIYHKLIKTRDEKTILIGVHVRRGEDYEIWRNGQYYFEDETYRKYVVNMKKEIVKRSGKSCIFIAFSNECADFLANNDTIISHNEWYVDQYLMSKCDYLIGPPSTFTFWASYIGKTKYFHIKDASGNIDIDKFEICKG